METIRMRDLRRIFQNKYVVFMGDSNMRSIYKDFILLLQDDKLMSDSDRKAGGNKESICGDILLEGGIYKNLASGIEYEEKRVFLANIFLVKFIFLTRCQNEVTLRLFEDFKKDTEKPDLVVINSTLWDISRYGGNGEKDFKTYLPLCFDDLRAATSPTTIILWLTALPISAEPNAAVFDEKYRPENKYWRTQFLHINAFSAELAKKKNCEVLDVHYLFRQHPELRDTDGCHWNSTGHRLITSYIAQTVSLIWHVPYIDRIAIDHKERELHRVCYRIVNDENENSLARTLTGENSEGITDFDLNAYLTEYIPSSTETPNEENPDRIGTIIGKMNETDRRILNLMDYYEKK
ncbi:unnamed protein product [Rotaria socialis]|uniref:Uncharacterized protein n=1 Tax=Rotaria socialis TaxID=392032 RepID=A0A817VX94_9BILA|nr:unnamed protein product [Rotaria socialis]CAF3344838.1 unnamed protein product [Rotaria socialis]CAF3421982.1 unnamed protein product [Rotaria socialis]CAF3695421.1 unnamed protein product [Rotaria socialis]CAF4365147.1 unnamed protein product [Rotaria socialis]